MTPLLEVEDLSVRYSVGSADSLLALDRVSFSIERGQILGVLGQSGSGKSTLAAALLRLLHPNASIENGVVRFEGHDLLKADTVTLRTVRGARIGSIFQDPLLALHPTLRVGRQVEDVLAAHQAVDRKTLRERALAALNMVFSKEVERIVESYPHELSGGQRARVLIAQAMVCNPSVIVADEPTASLDPLTQREVLSLFRRFRVQLGLSVMLITHNPLLLSGFADRVMVLYAGRVVEIGPAEDLLLCPQHPYTQGLLGCMPRMPDIGKNQHKCKLPFVQEYVLASPVLKRQCAFEKRGDDQRGVRHSKTSISSLVRW